MMSTFMDYMISPYPIRIIEPKVGPSMLKLKTIRIGRVGHLPGRTLFRSDAVFGHWAVVYIAQGAGTYCENGGKVQQVQGGSMFFFRPDASYTFGPLPGGSWDEYYIDFSGTRTEEWKAAGLLQGGAVLQGYPPEEWLHTFKSALELMDSGSAADADRAALLLENMLVARAYAAKDSGSARQEDLLSRVRSDLAACVYGELEPQHIAAKHHISMSTLRRQIRGSSGYPLHEYIHRLKMAEAKHLLLNTSLQVKEIAGLLHYADPFYFSRLFKTYMGVSPQVCRSRDR